MQNTSDKNQETKVAVAVWGSTGYVGQELMKILENHPNVDSVTTVGRDMPADVSDIQVAFLALPHGESATVAAYLRSAGVAVIDLSGDFRFKTAAEYEQWYHQTHTAPKLLPASYGLPELRQQDQRGSQLIAVPGCYPTATLLGIIPLLRKSLIQSDMLIVDAVSGTSGMGKSKKEVADEIEQSGNLYTYSAGRVHRHVGEIEQFLDGRKILFSPSVGPYFRGMLVKVTAKLAEHANAELVDATLRAAYKDEPFVKVCLVGETPSVADTVNTAMCHIGVVVVDDTVQVISSIDNLMKGAASQAVQDFNAMQGLVETIGLEVYLEAQP